MCASLMRTERSMLRRSASVKNVRIDDVLDFFITELIRKPIPAHPNV